MKTGFFLIPTVYASGGVVLDYKFVEHKIDKRTRFWRLHGKHEVSSFVAISAAERIGMQIFRNDDGAVTRVLAQNGKKAYEYQKHMRAQGYGAEEGENND